MAADLARDEAEIRALVARCLEATRAGEQAAVRDANLPGPA